MNSLLTKVDLDYSIDVGRAESYVKSVESAADVVVPTKIFEVTIVSDFPHDIIRPIFNRSQAFRVAAWADLKACGWHLHS